MRSKSAQAAYPGSDGLIAFVRDGNIYAINPGEHHSRLDGIPADAQWT